MYLKGEGTPQNYTAAHEWYEKALDQDSALPRPLNGLGFMYFHGNRKDITTPV